ncbi:2-aminoethylphosphonate-pyruvate transaminase [Skermanella aerolata]|uniref:2-aminoethylphosphonate--pyruvate transaminase n=1 Tax=Skermanella aerolata TaxID=393310 RepID=UPI003D1F6F24
MTTNWDGNPSENLLLTPGPLTTTPATRRAMQRDWGSRDCDFIELTARIRRRLLAVVGGEAAAMTCVPIQGSGTFAVEAALQTLVPRDGKLLILVNGAYGRRMAEICRVTGRAHEVLEWPEDRPVDPAAVAAALEADRAVTDVAVVHVETTSGLLNPLAEVAEVVAIAGRRLHVDAMSSFGAIGIEAGAMQFTSLFASSNKCLEGVPGIGFVIADVVALTCAKGNAVSLALDLEAQWRGLESAGQWRFTPPTHVLAALDAALDQFDAEGGVPGRFTRYSRNCAVLCAGMRELGFTPWLDDALQAPVIVTFRIPDGGWFRFAEFYDSLHARGIVIYPGKLTALDSFRIGCIGAIGEAEIRRALGVIAETVAAMRG